MGAEFFWLEVVLLGMEVAPLIGRRWEPLLPGSGLMLQSTQEEKVMGVDAELTCSI